MGFVAYMVEWREGFGGDDLRERCHLVDLGIDGKIILKIIFIKYSGGHDWIDAVQDRDKWDPCEHGNKTFVLQKIAGNLLTG